MWTYFFGMWETLETEISYFLSDFRSCNFTIKNGFKNFKVFWLFWDFWKICLLSGLNGFGSPKKWRNLQNRLVDLTDLDLKTQTRRSSVPRLLFQELSKVIATHFNLQDNWYTYFKKARQTEKKIAKGPLHCFTFSLEFVEQKPQKSLQQFWIFVPWKVQCLKETLTQSQGSWVKKIHFHYQLKVHSRPGHSSERFESLKHGSILRSTTSTDSKT